MAKDYAARNAEGAHRIADDDPGAIALLKEEHHRFRELFTAAEAAEGAALKPIADEICLRLDVHMTIEEELLYPIARNAGEDGEVREGIVEHDAGKTLAAEIVQLTGEEELYKAKVHVLGEQTIHHIDEEDEDLFAELKQAHEAGRIDLDAVGAEMRARQAELYERVITDGDVGETDEENADEQPKAA